MLYKLAEKFPALKQNKNKIINYLRRRWSNAVCHHRDNTDGLRENFRQIPKHVFAVKDHLECGSWCKAKGDKNYKITGLPNGKPLTDPNLLEELTNIFEIFALNSDRISPGASTQRNENFNMVVASKAPKKIHYSSSESLSYRVAAAAAQTIQGKSYICDVMDSLNLSPSRSYRHRAEIQDKQREKERSKKTTKVFKENRVKLAAQRGKKLERLDKKEGATYSSGIDLLPDTSSFSIPQHTPEPKMIPFTPTNEWIYFDLETSGSCSDEPAAICQIAAKSLHGEYNKYILPTTPITTYVTKITGLTLHDNTLCYKRKPVPTVSLKEGLQSFIDFVKSNVNEKVTLVAHNAKSFDAQILVTAISECGLEAEFTNIIAGFLDSCIVMKMAYPGKKAMHNKNCM